MRLIHGALGAASALNAGDTLRTLIADTFATAGTADTGIARVLQGTASIASGYLECTAAGAYAQYGSTSFPPGASPTIDPARDKGEVTFTYTPLYSGIPAATRGLIGLAENSSAQGRFHNETTLVHDTDGHIWVYFADGAGASSNPDGDFGAWAPVSGTPYQFRFTWDNTGPVASVRVYIDGVLLHEETFDQLDRSTASFGLFTVGHVLAWAPTTPNFRIDNLILKGGG